MENKMNKLEVLKQAFDTRIDEVAGYQINIDNYSLAIPLAESDPDLVDFAAQLRALLASEKLEQKKAKIMLSVLETQIGSL